MDSGDKIQQTVTVSGQAQTGDITLIGKIVYVIQNPALWQDALWSFITGQRYFLMAWAALQALLAWGWLSFHKLYLISPALWALAAILLTAAAWGSYAQARGRRSRVGLAATLLGSASLAGLLGWQAWRIALPPAFDTGTFGIAFAELGEGGDYASTPRAREISDQAYEYLCQTIHKDFLNETGHDPCWLEAGRHEGRIQVQHAGIISSPEMAEAYGRKVRAKVVIWGNLLVSREGAASVRFQMLETPDRAVSPDLPLILPVMLNATDLFSEEMDLSSDPLKLKAVVAQESSLISATTLGLAAFATMDYPRAVTQFQTAEQVLAQTDALTVSPQGQSLLGYYAGRANLYMGRMSAGLERLEAAQKIYPQEPAIYLTMASAYINQGKTAEKEAALKEADAHLQDWLDTHPNDTQAIFDRGMLHMTDRAFDEAILDFQKTLELNPDFFVAYISLAQAYVGAGQIGQAEAALGKAEAALGQAKAALGKAEAELDQALALAEKVGANPMWVYVNRGLVRDKAGETLAARQDFQAAIAAEPENQWPYYYYATFLDVHGEADGALLNYQKLSSLAWNKGWAYGRLADFYRRRGLLTQAIDHYRRAVHESPQDSLLRVYLAETLDEAGHDDAALENYRAAVALDEPIPYVYARYAIALYHRGQYRDAALWFERALQLQPEDEVSLYNLGLAYEASGQPEKAVPLYQQILKNAGQPPSDLVQQARQRLENLGVLAP